MTIRPLVAGVLALVTSWSLAATSGSVEYEPIAGASPEPLAPIGPTTPQEMEAFVDGFMAGQLPAGPVAGATVAVVRDGALFFTKGYGFEDVEKRTPVDPRETRFRPGSISKLFTWTAVMQLVEAGKLDLDADVNTYLEDIKLPETWPEPVTLRNLMTHTPGFEDGGIGYLFADSEKNLVSLGDWLKAHMPARVRPPTTDFASGTNASYSNWGTSLAGYIVQTVSGMPFDDYIDQHIFVPLGMKHSTFREPVPGQIEGHEGGGFSVEQGTFVRKGFEFIHATAPAGALSSTATDMAQFMLAYLQNGAVGDGRILAPETVRTMQTRVMSPDPALNGHALGFYESWINGRRVIGHGGDTLYFHSELGLIPEANLGFFVSINTGGKGARTSIAFQEAFVKHYFPARLPIVKPRADAAERNARYAGTYRGLRHSYTKFEKVFAATTDIKAVPMPDGTLFMPDPILGEPSRWIEVGDGVFRKVDNDTFIAFKGDAGGHPTNIVGWFPAIATARISWYQTGAFHGIIAGLAILFAITMLVSALRQRRADRAGPPNLRWARPSLALAGVCFLLFIIGIAITLAMGLEKLIFHLPSMLYVSLVFPLLAIPLVLAALYFTWVAWKSRAWRLGTRLHYTAAALTALAFLFVLNYWNLVGYHFG
jgi:CubicO group peptidase (beta-lactamase class C family)